MLLGVFNWNLFKNVSKFGKKFISEKVAGIKLITLVRKKMLHKHYLRILTALFAQNMNFDENR